MTAKAYLLKIRGGVEVDSKGQKAGKGPLIAEEISNTLGTSQDQYLFQPVGVDCYNLTLTGDKGRCLATASGGLNEHIPVVLQPIDKFVLDDQGGSVIHWRWDGKSPCLRAQMDGHPPVVLESHPNDSRVKIDDSGSIQTLTSRMGTGGGNVPMVMMPFSKSRRAKSAEDFETWKESRVSNTINTFDQGDVRATDVVVCIQGNVIDRSDNAGANGAGWRLNQCYTLNTIDRPAVVYAMDVFHCNSAEERAASLKARDYKDPQIVVMSERAMSMVTSKRVANTLAATDYKGVQILAIDRAAFNQGENAKYDFQIDGGGTAQTLIARGPGAVCYRKPVRK